MQSGIIKRIKEKEKERDSFEIQISNVDLSHIDEREKNMVRMASLCPCSGLQTYFPFGKYNI